MLPIQINNIVTGYAQIEVINPTFLAREILPFVIKNQNSLTLQSQIKISHLLAKKDIYSEKFCQQLVYSFINSSEILDSSEIIDLQWGLSKIRYFDRNFFLEWKNRILPNMMLLENHDLAKSILATAKNDYFSEDLTHAFINTLKERDLNNHDLINTIYGLTLIMITKKQSYLQSDISDLLRKIDPLSISTTSEMRQLISSYNSLDSSYKNTLTNLDSVVNSWSSNIRQETQPIVSHSQSLIKNLLLKYDPEAQEEVWVESLATLVDIYLPSIKTYVQVDGPTHFYRNEPSHYTTTSQFNSAFLENEGGKYLLRILNLNPRSYHKVISKALNDRFFDSSPIEASTETANDLVKSNSPSTAEEIIISSVEREESVVEFSNKTIPTHKSAKKNKQARNLKTPTNEDKLIIEDDTSSKPTDYKDKLKALAQKYKIKKNADFYNNFFEICIREKDFELVPYLIKNYNLTKFNSFLTFLNNEVKEGLFNNQLQFEQLIEVFNAAIERNIFNEVNCMLLMINNENLIKFIALTNYDFDKGVVWPDGTIRNAATYMLMEKGYFDISISLIKNEKLTHACDEQITLPLVLCAIYYDPQNKDEMNKQKICLETLLNYHFSPEVYDRDFTTPILHCFMQATKYKFSNIDLYEHYINLGNVLLSHNVSIAVKPLAQGGTLLSAAVSAEHEELVAKLLATSLPYGVDDFSSDPMGQNIPPLYIAISTGNIRICELLLQGGSSPEGEFNVKELTIDPIDNSSKIEIKKGQTPLFIAAEMEDPELINLLVKYGANINYQTKIGITLIHKIIQRNTFSLCESVINNGFYNEKGFKFLLERANSCSEEIKSKIRLYQSDPVDFILQVEELDQDSKIRSLTALLSAESLPAEHRTKALNQIAQLKGIIQQTSALGNFFEPVLGTTAERATVCKEVHDDSVTSKWSKKSLMRKSIHNQHTSIVSDVPSPSVQKQTYTERITQKRLLDKNTAKARDP